VRLASAICLSAAVLPAAVLGQSVSESDTGSRLLHPAPADIPNSGASAAIVARIVTRNFARCEVDKEPRKVLAALSSPVGSDEEALKRSVSSDCLRAGMLRMPNSIYRGALFGELYRRNQKTTANVTAAFPPVALDWTTQSDVNAPTEVRAHHFLMWMADCLYEAAPEAMRTIVLEQPDSKASAAAFTEVGAHLGVCIPADQKLSLSRAVLEGLFSEYLYRSLVPAIRPAGKVH